jgi:hypothetical protein
MEHISDRGFLSPLSIDFQPWLPCVCSLQVCYVEHSKRLKNALKAQKEMRKQISFLYFKNNSHLKKRFVLLLLFLNTFL